MISANFVCLEFFILDPPSNMTAKHSSPSSLVIRWNSYFGNATLSGYRVMVFNQGHREGSVDSTHIMSQELIKNFTVGANINELEIKNLSSFTKYCVKIGVMANEGIGNLSQCFYFSTEKGKCG